MDIIAVNIILIIPEMTGGKAVTKKTKITIIILGVVIAILAAVIIVMIVRGKKDTPAQALEQPEKRSTLITEDNADEVLG